MAGVEPKRELDERRWLIVVGNGDHVTLSGHGEPSDHEVQEAAAQLDSLAVCGWLVVLTGAYYGRGSVTLFPVRRISAADGNWNQADSRWRAKRAAATGDTRGRA